ncbi:MAG: hypothetical protein FJ040_14575, partial [Chloroflexi bacterium]|nr:hypothetical protein [Chloroflexota bacterium]
MSLDPHRYPHTCAAFAAMNASDHLERIVRLDEIWRGIRETVASDAPSLAHRRAWQSVSHAQMATHVAHAQW